MVVYGYRGSLWVYEIATNTRRPLVKGAEQCWYHSPHFIDRRTVEFEGGDDVATVDIVTGVVRSFAKRVQRSDWVAGLWVSKDHRFLADLGGLGDQFRLVASSLQTGKILFSKKIGYVCGCDGGPWDDGASWSNSSSFLLVSVPTASSARVYVFDRSGRRVIEPLEGGDAQWIGDTDSFIYESGSAPSGTWAKIDLTTGKRTPFLRTSRHLQGPAFSPSGAKVAFTDMDKRVPVVYDLASRTLRDYAPAHAWPVWLSETVFIADRVSPCVCEGWGFEPVGVVSAFDVDAKTPRRLAITEAYGADLLY